MSRTHQIYKGRIVDLRLEEIRLPNQVTTTIEMIRHPGAAAVVPLHDDGEVTLLHQFRHAAGGFIWEIPAGTLNSGEEPRRCAARELQEEAGLTARELIALGSVFTAPGFCDERIHLFLARGLTPTAQALDHDEVLSLRRLPLAQALAMIHSGEIADAKSIAGLYRAAEYVRRKA
jgi:ADP-ribose pyrophosphatase